MESELDVRERTLAAIESVGTDADEVSFRDALWDAGVAMVQFPRGKGGLAASPRLQAVVDETIQAAGRPFNLLAPNPIGIGMGLPTLLTYGSEAHHDRYLKRIYTGEDIWCQMFSEPSHGSDVAGLASRAERDGDEWVINGQKVWTSLAHRSAYGMLLVRTDPDVPKHRGLSYFICAMDAPGVEIRPLYQMTGEAEFNVVFLTDVRIPHSDLLGGIGEGWPVATTTLMNERVALGGTSAPRDSGTIATLLAAWERVAPTLTPDRRATMRCRVAQHWIDAQALRLTSLRARATARAGNPGPEGSVGKLASAELNQRILETAMALLGNEAMLYDEGDPLARSEHRGQSSYGPVKSFLRAQANTIEGGTSEIMRNILGERVLGLPGDVRVDKDKPWRDIPT